MMFRIMDTDKPAIFALEGSHAYGEKVAATRGLFTGKAHEVFAEPVFDGIIVTDTVAPERLTDKTARAKRAIIGSAPLIAAAIEGETGAV